MSWLTDIAGVVLGDATTQAVKPPPGWKTGTVPSTPPISGGSGGNIIDQILKNLPGTTGTPGLPPLGGLNLPTNPTGGNGRPGVLLSPTVNPPDLGGGVATQALNVWIASVNAVINDVTSWGHNFTEAIKRGTKFAAVDVVLLLLFVYGIGVVISGDSDGGTGKVIRRLTSG